MKLILLLIVAALIVGAFFYFEKNRSDALAKVANELGFQFKAGQQNLPSELDEIGFYLFSQGSRQITNLMQGRKGDYDIAVFGYFYDAGVGMEGQRELPISNDDGEIQRRGQSVAWIHSARHNLPDFDLTPVKGAIRRVAQEDNLQRITFDGNRAFDDKYVLTGRDAAAVRGLFNEEVQRFLETHPEFTFESRGHDALLYRNQERVDPANIPDLLNLAEEFMDLLSTSRKSDA